MLLEQIREQRGVVLIMMAGVLVVLLLIIGLAVDAGNLYRARLALQNAADSAAIAGVGYTVRLGRFELDREVKQEQGAWTIGDSAQRDAKITAHINPKAEEVAQAVMGRSGYPHVSGGSYEVSLRGAFTSPAPLALTGDVYRYQTEVTRRIDLLLLDLIPGTNAAGFKQLTARATAQRRIGYIVVFIDVSDSMNCPATGSCDCILVPDSDPCTGLTKMDELVSALKVFAKMFDPGRDKLYVVPFNIRGKAYSLEDLKAGAGITGNLEELDEAKIDLIIEYASALHSPSGSTNLCDALTRGQVLLRTDTLPNGRSIWGNRDISYVIFSDGAPTAGRFFFDDVKRDSTGVSILPIWQPIPGAGAYDYTVYSVQWKDSSDPSSTDVILGPSVLVQTDLLGMNFDEAKPPTPGSGSDDAGNPSAAGWAACSETTTGTNKPLREVASDTELARVAREVFSPCLRSLSARVPYEWWSSYGRNYRRRWGWGTGPGVGRWKKFRDWQEQYFNCAIEMTDQFRRNRGTVYTVGLGNPAEFIDSSGVPLNAYQNSQDVASRHDVFNARLANDDIEAIELNTYPDWNYDGYETFETSAANGRQGIYLALDEGQSDELKEVFRAIANTILLRLSQ